MQQQQQQRRRALDIITNLAGSPKFSSYLLTQGSGFLIAVWKAIIQPWNCSCCTSKEGMPMKVQLQNTLQISLMNSGTCTQGQRVSSCWHAVELTVGLCKNGHHPPGWDP